MDASHLIPISTHLLEMKQISIEAMADEFLSFATLDHRLAIVKQAQDEARIATEKARQLYIDYTKDNHQ